MTSSDRPPLTDPPPGAESGMLPLTSRQRRSLFLPPAMLAGATLFVSFIAAVASSDGLSFGALLAWGFVMIVAIAAGVAARDALDDSRRPAEVRLLRLEALASRQRRHKLRRYYAQFESLEPFEVSFAQYAGLAEGDRYWVTYSPHSHTLWAINPTALAGGAASGGGLTQGAP